MPLFTVHRTSVNSTSHSQRNVINAPPTSIMLCTHGLPHQSLFNHFASDSTFTPNFESCRHCSRNVNSTSPQPAQHDPRASDQPPIALPLPPHQSLFNHIASDSTFAPNFESRRSSSSYAYTAAHSAPGPPSRACARLCANASPLG